MQKSKRILIVDDLPTNLTLIKTMLELEGYQVATANCTETATEMLRAEHYDAIFLDVMMPLIDGIEYCRRVKNDRQTYNIPVIMLTALLDDRTRQNGFAAGADAFLTKPATFQQLNDVIEGVTNKSARRPGQPYYTADPRAIATGALVAPWR
jgi:CheY-like chemotaxis protein